MDEYIAEEIIEKELQLMDKLLDELAKKESEVAMKREFLVQYVMEDVKVNKIMSENEVIELENMSDVYPIENIRVYDINEIGIVKPLKYKGWQPMCLIEFEDADGNVVIRGYGEDH